MRGAESCRRSGHGGACAGIEQFECADGGDHDRQAQVSAEFLDRCIDLCNVSKHAPPECYLVERHAIAAHGGLGLGGADNVVPGILVEVRPRLRYELVKVL